MQSAQLETVPSSPNNAASAASPISSKKVAADGSLLQEQSPPVLHEISATINSKGKEKLQRVGAGREKGINSHTASVLNG